MKKYFKAYFELIKELDSKITILEDEHNVHITCKRKCSLCCMEFGILPIEFYAISSKLSNHEIKSTHKKKCKFLKNDECVIYNYRPIICRTQGLPNIYYNEHNQVFELSVCNLNFTKVKDDYFTEDNTLLMDIYNQKLQEINTNFIKNAKNLELNINKLISLNSL